MFEDRKVKPSERAYCRIRDAILSGDLPPGAHLREEPLAELTETSRTPVREALRRLVADGLAAERNRHRFVSEFSQTEMDVMYDIRARIEGYSAALAARNMGEEDLVLLERLVEQMDGIDPEGGQASVDGFRRKNAQFHNLIIRSTGSVQLGRMVRPALLTTESLVKQHIFKQPVAIRASNKQHRELVLAFRARSPDWAEAIMRAHVFSTMPSHKP
ncbi:GntR family transcriptional regulator (plasmid) [Thioclava sp. 'Guangxiensis']|uniref:GntR family transcriptional regulator n=1 Tax=Thioclava sp. 'Guangxiensis' TaxID=3149044 RepID=UPI003877BAE9